MAQKKRGLGKGLDALFEDNATNDPAGSVELKISEIEPNRAQPRKSFDQETLAELAESIKQHGVLSPLLVRPLPQGNYQLVAGERRWRAARMAGLSEVPVIIREMGDTEATEIALIENLQRENLNPIEEAMGFRRLMEEFAFTQEDVSRRVNKSRSSVANALRLLHLPDATLRQVENGLLSTGHAKALLALEEEGQIIELADAIVKGGMSVREAEKAVRNLAPKEGAGARKGKMAAFPTETYYKELEISLHEGLGRKVKINQAGGKGTLILEFFDKEDLRELAKRLYGG